jgi:hypothetical protein
MELFNKKENEQKKQDYTDEEKQMEKTKNPCSTTNDGTRRRGVKAIQKTDENTKSPKSSTRKRIE